MSSQDVCVPYFKSVFMRYWQTARAETKAVSWIWMLRWGPVLTEQRTRRGITDVYFDSFDNLRPPKELVRYFENDVTIECTIMRLIVRLKLLRHICACGFYKQLMYVNLKSSTKCRENSVLVECFFQHVAERLCWTERAPSSRRTTFPP